MSRSYTSSPPQAPSWRVTGRLYFTLLFTCSSGSPASCLFDSFFVFIRMRTGHQTVNETVGNFLIVRNCSVRLDCDPAVNTTHFAKRRDLCGNTKWPFCEVMTFEKGYEVQKFL
jgi:hypothetical protein